MPNTLDTLMESASQALADGDYPQCEALCVQALAQARSALDWAEYARIVLPLQESRRLKRQAALEGRIRLGTADCDANAASLLDGLDAGCLVITDPLSAEDAQQLAQTADTSRKPIGILYADPMTDTAWTLRGLPGADYAAQCSAPPSAWQSRWTPGGSDTTSTPAHWWMQASEALGNAALASIDAELGTVERVAELEAALSAVGDHELLHQALADAARAAQHGGAR
ncbi:MAG: hypothetical protein AAGA29_01545 [Planctomycetota bacterium]